MSEINNMRWLRFRVSSFFKQYHRWKREEYGDDLDAFHKDRDWAYAVYDNCQERIFPDVGIYLLYFDEYGPRGVGSPYSVYKIGLSDRMRKRWSTLQTGTPIELRPIHVIETNALRWAEGWLHNALRSRRIYDDQEWFALSMSDIKALLAIDVLNKSRTPQCEVELLQLYEIFNPPDASQLGLFDL